MDNIDISTIEEDQLAVFLMRQSIGNMITMTDT